MVNVLWGMFNLVVAYVLVARVGRFDLRQTRHAVDVPVIETPPSAPLTLAELCQAVQAIGGCLRRDADRCIVDAATGSITPEIETGLAEHQDELLTLLPPPPMAVIKPSDDNRNRVMSDDEWNAYLQAM
jgi:hypothetical protein